MPSVKEGTSADLDVTFLDENSSVVTPTTVQYSIVCDTTRTVITSMNTVTAAGTLTISIPDSANELQDSASKVERRQVMIVAGYGFGLQFVGEFEYTVNAAGYYP